ncbi:MAG TPA: hypothetical protein VNH11_25935 [Pirellulales bacterium]|nr:hypothetical protein [Pirellulales bacterium]
MPIGTRRAAARKAARSRNWRKRPLYIKQILAWADAHHEETGQWPRSDSGRVRGTLEEKWQSIDNALHLGLRGMPGGDSLPRVMARYRGVRNRKALPRYTIPQILRWADAHFKKHGQWPLSHSGGVEEAAGETWMAVQVALRNGQRGLPGGSSLAKLLAEHRGRRNMGDLPPFKIGEIVKWADAHQKRTGMWPTPETGPVTEAVGETWHAVDQALRHGIRGMRGGSSLARLLKRERGVQMKHRRQPPLSIETLLARADEHHQRTGQWPNVNSGAIASAPNETWGKVQIALHAGKRGFKGGSSIARLLAEHRQVRYHLDLPDFTVKQILAWADAHFERHGRWPTQTSGKIPQSPGDSWGIIDIALRRAARGLPAGWSLGKLWARYRGARNIHSIARFSAAQLLRWADAHHRRTGQWPQVRSGPIVESPADNWLSVDNALRLGLRGMRGGSSLKQFLDQHRRKRRAT